MHRKTRLSRNALILVIVGWAVFSGCRKEPTARQPAGPAAKETASAAPADAAQVEVAMVQKTCPVMEGNPINKAIFVEYKGEKIYFCCKGCPETFLANPEKYVAKLPQFQN